MRAMVTLAESLTYGRQAFIEGIQAHGYQVVRSIAEPAPDNVLIIWNRRGMDMSWALKFEARGAKVFVVENGYMGKTWLGKKWFAVAKNHHNGAGYWHDGGPERWASWGAELAPYRTDGKEIVLLPQRGIGEPGVRMPDDWPRRAAKALGVLGYPLRVRPHPGAVETVPLENDLKDAFAAATWGSGAAIKALTLGVPVIYDLQKWVGGLAGSFAPFVTTTEHINRKEDQRQKMFERMAWAMWTLEEVSSGECFKPYL